VSHQTEAAKFAKEREENSIASKKQVIDQKKQMDELKAELDSLKTQGADKEKLIAEHKARDIASAEKSSRLMLERLQSTLRSFHGNSNDTVEFKANDTDQVKMHQSVGKLAEQAINAVETLQHKTVVSDMNANTAKRSRDEMIGALAPFGGGTVGTVNASAGKFAKNTDGQLPGDQAPAAVLRAWMQQNTNATWQQVEHQFGLLNAPVLTGTVNASAGTWNKSHLGTSTRDDPRLSAMHLQPDLFHEMGSMVTGRMPSVDETISLCKSVNVQTHGPPR
jgi:hypothetical protein